MMEMYKEMTEWALYNWDNYKLFYCIFFGTAAFGGILIYQGFISLYDTLTDFFKK